MATLRTLVEQALVGYLRANNVGGNIVSGQDSGNKSTPLVVCSIRAAEEDPVFSGNWNCECTVEVKQHAAPENRETPDEKNDTQAEDFTDTSDEISEEILRALTVDSAETLGSLIEQQVDGLKVYGATAARRVEYETNGDLWIETIRIHLLCALTVSGS